MPVLLFPHGKYHKISKKLDLSDSGLFPRLYWTYFIAKDLYHGNLKLLIKKTKENKPKKPIFIWEGASDLSYWILISTIFHYLKYFESCSESFFFEGTGIFLSGYGRKHFLDDWSVFSYCIVSIIYCWYNSGEQEHLHYAKNVFQFMSLLSLFLV